MYITKPRGIRNGLSCLVFETKRSRDLFDQQTGPCGFIPNLYELRAELSQEDGPETYVCTVNSSSGEILSKRKITEACVEKAMRATLNGLADYLSKSIVRLSEELHDSTKDVYLRLPPLLFCRSSRRVPYRPVSKTCWIAR